MSDYKNRLDEVIQYIREDGLDGVLILSPAGSCYLSGCYLLTQSIIPARQAFVLISSGGAISYLVCNIEERMARQDSWIADIRSYVEFVEEPVEALANLLVERGMSGARLGVEARTLPAGSYRHLQEALPKVAFQTWDARLAEIMMIKDDAEISAIETAGRQTQAAIENGLTSAMPESTENDVAGRIWDGLLKHGMTPLFNVFASGPRTVLVHGEPTARVMKPGEIVRLDMGGRFPSHYLSDMARTAVVGEPDKVQAQAFQKLTLAQQAVFDGIRPGVPVSELFHACQQSYEKQGIPFFMPHIGHGIGIGLHEDPMIHPRNSTPLEAGMVLNIEPFLLFEERQEGYHIEDLVVVTADGYRLLTEPQKELIRIPG